MRNLVLLIVGGLLSLQSCAPPKSESDGFSRDEQNAPSILREAHRSVRSAKNVRSFIVSHDNQLIAEKYKQPVASDSLDHVRSVTKSVMALLIGIAIDKGIIDQVDDPIGKYLDISETDKEAITIKHLLTMTSGISWAEGPGPGGYQAWARSENELNYVLHKPMAAKPGTVWNYNSGSIHILSAILTEAAGINTYEFANKHLFTPLGIRNIRWERNADGYYNGAAGLELKPIDMIKLGQLMADDGLFKDQRIISSQFIKEATSHHQPKNMQLDKDAGYGYCWYVTKHKGATIYAALGYAGQAIVVAPELKTVIAITQRWQVNGTQASAQTEESNNKIASKVIEAIMEK